MLAAGDTPEIVHTHAPRSISSHLAPRASPGLTAVNTMNSKHSFVPTHADETFTASKAPATFLCGSAVNHPFRP